jgi:hypothetical protein
MIHIVFEIHDAWCRRTRHGINPTYLQGYLNEFNRRFWPVVAIDSDLKTAPLGLYRYFYEAV